MRPLVLKEEDLLAINVATCEIIQNTAGDLERVRQNTVCRCTVKSVAAL